KFVLCRVCGLSSFRGTKCPTRPSSALLSSLEVEACSELRQCAPNAGRSCVRGGACRRDVPQTRIYPKLDIVEDLLCAPGSHLLRPAAAVSLRPEFCLPAHCYWQLPLPWPNPKGRSAVKPAS